MSRPGPGFSLSDGWDLSGLTLTELWLGYLAVGGTASPARVAAWARSRLRPDSHQHNMIAQAINEHFTDLGEDHPVSLDIPLPLTGPATHASRLQERARNQPPMEAPHGWRQPPAASRILLVQPRLGSGHLSGAVPAVARALGPERILDLEAYTWNSRQSPRTRLRNSPGTPSNRP
jgi:hypothetical protein